MYHTRPPSSPLRAPLGARDPTQPSAGFPPTQDSPSPKAHLPLTQMPHMLEAGVQQHPGEQACPAGKETAQGLPYWFTLPDPPWPTSPNCPETSRLLGA